MKTFFIDYSKFPYSVRPLFPHAPWEEMDDWLLENIGAKNFEWICPYLGITRVSYYFKNEQDAAAFKLRWV